jgi:ketosteroid isomerase-like protein
MLDSIINAFTKGDLADLNSKMLHSAYWGQHNAKFYGSEKLNMILGNWFALTGKCTVLAHQTIKQNNHYVVYLTFETTNKNGTINYVFWLETNQLMVKSVLAIVDTVQLAALNQDSPEKVSDNLPSTDPLVISDYDQQDNLQNNIAWPSNLISKQAQNVEILDQWWAIWSQKQLANINTLYNDDAVINLPGDKHPQKRERLFEFVLSKINTLTRMFTQIEDIAIEGQDVAIKWFLDGDEGENKIRLPFITLLKIENSKITVDTTVCDILAFNKNFSTSHVFKQPTA